MMTELSTQTAALERMYDARARLFDAILKDDMAAIPELITEFQVASETYGRVTR
jgi:hypothetical protein